MLSPSLISMIVHSVWSDSETLQFPNQFPAYRDLARALDPVTRMGRTEPWPKVPIVGWSIDPSPVMKAFESHIRMAEYSSPRGMFFWGRVPLDRLIGYFRDRNDIPGDNEYVDLGAPIREHSGGTSSSAATSEQICRNLLAQSETSPATVAVAVIDRGVDAPNRSPESFNRKLRHAVTSGIEIGPHAMDVLSVLLERLRSNGILDETRVYCSLVREPKPSSGLTIFDHASSCEMLDAVNDLKAAIASETLPVAVNLSMGNHVGPHNGDSPLEGAVGGALNPSQGRYLHVSAGNDGLTGIAARRELQANVREYLRLRTGPHEGDTVLVELWWPEVQPVQMTIEVWVSTVPTRTMPQTTLGIATLQPSQAGSVSQTQTGLLGRGVSFESLFQARCRNNMSCAAFVLSVKKNQGLPELDVDFHLECDTDLVVQTWIVASEDPATVFLGGDDAGTINVPSTGAEVICVAGMESQHRPWSRSSRGPGGRYQIGATVATGTAPRMAHLCGVLRLGGHATSYASPRACADAAAVIRHPNNRLKCNTADKLVFEVLGQGVTATPPWDPRIGYGAITS